MFYLGTSICSEGELYIMIIVDMHQVLISNLMVQMNRVSYNGTKKGEANKEMVRHMVCNSLRGYVVKFGNEYGKDLVLAGDAAGCRPI